MRAAAVIVAAAAMVGVTDARAWADGADAARLHDESATETVRAVSQTKSHEARADLPARLANPDTADGRVDGDASLVAGLGVTVADHARGSAELRLRYLEMVGLFGTYDEGFGVSDGIARVLTTGLEARPLFLGRWVTGTELGLRWADLVIDSLGLEVGTFFEQQGTRAFGSQQGLQASLGLEFPLGLSAEGAFLDVHGGGRWSDGVLAGGAVQGPADRSLFLTFTLAYHHTFATHLVDFGDRGL